MCNLAKATFISAVMFCFLVAFNVTAFAWPNPPTVAEILDDEGIAEELESEWTASRSDDQANRHEEGGWIMQCRTWNGSSYDLSFSIISVPAGTTAGLSPGTAPNDDEDCRVVGFKHTHPNPPTDENGNTWDQGPSKADERWHERHNIPGIIVNDSGTVTTGPDSGVDIGVYE